jgi:hypothetical protein
MNSRYNWHKYNSEKWVLGIVVFFSFTFLSCTVGVGGEKQPPVVSNDKPVWQKIDLVAILSKADRYNAKVVKVGGVFKGWKGTCASSFSITRSDWIIGDGPDCIYVSGLLPPDLSTVRPMNERIEVVGKVRVAADGKVHLEAMEIKLCQ